MTYKAFDINGNPIKLNSGEKIGNFSTVLNPDIKLKDIYTFTDQDLDDKFPEKLLLDLLSYVGGTSQKLSMIVTTPY